MSAVAPSFRRSRARERLLAFGRASDLCWRIVRGVLSGRVRIYFSEVWRQAAIFTSSSLLVILGLVLAFGLIVGTEGAYAARLVGAPSAAGAFTALGDLREVIPFAFGFMMAAKVSTGYVAEIGTMRITDEIDALDVMGLDSLLYLGSTRLLATWIVLPFIYALSVLICFAGSFLVVVDQIGQSSAGGYLDLFWKFQSVSDYAFSILKGMTMSTFVVIVGCAYGYSVRGGPVDVGKATARAMTVNLVGVNFIGILGSQFFWGGTPRLPIGG